MWKYSSKIRHNLYSILQLCLCAYDPSLVAFSGISELFLRNQAICRGTMRAIRIKTKLDNELKTILSSIEMRETVELSDYCVKSPLQVLSPYKCFTAALAFELAVE